MLFDQDIDLEWLHKEIKSLRLELARREVKSLLLYLASEQAARNFRVAILRARDAAWEREWKYRPDQAL